MSNVTLSEVLLGEQILKLESENESLQAQVTQLAQEREVAVERESAQERVRTSPSGYGQRVITAAEEKRINSLLNPDEKRGGMMNERIENSHKSKRELRGRLIERAREFCISRQWQFFDKELELMADFAIELEILGRLRSKEE